MPEPCAQLEDYVLGALDAPARRAFAAHVERCAVCAGEEDALRPVRDALALAVPRREPPAHLRASVLAEVRREALGTAGTPAEPSARWSRVARPAHDAGSGPSGWLASAHPQARRWRLAWPGLAAAGVAAALVLGIDPGTRTIPVTGASGTLELADGGAARLELRGLPSPGPGRVYQVWIRPRGVAGPRPTEALFDVTRSGAGAVAVPGRLRAGDTVLVTSEPRGGSRTPSRLPTLRARV